MKYNLAKVIYWCSGFIQSIIHLNEFLPKNSYLIPISSKKTHLPFRYNEDIVGIHLIYRKTLAFFNLSPIWESLQSPMEEKKHLFLKLLQYCAQTFGLFT